MAGAASSAQPAPDHRPARGGGHVAWLIFGFSAALVCIVAASVYDLLVTLEPSIDCYWSGSTWRGGETAGTTIAPLLGLGLLTVGGVASWRHPSGDFRAWLFLGLAALYIGTLVVIWYALPPGPYHCVWTP